MTTIKRILQIQIGLNEVLHTVTILLLIIHMMTVRELNMRVDSLSAIVSGHILSTQK